jgi:hypothetical protein
MRQTTAYLNSIGFDYDIFISYAHVDNLPSQGLTKWVDSFQEALAGKLAQRLGRLGQLNMWRDPNLDPTQIVDQVLENRVKKSAIFVALISNGYIASDYCLKELDLFAEGARSDAQGLVINERNRIIHVHLTNIPDQKWPGVIRALGTEGVSFHDALDDLQIGEPIKPVTSEFDRQMRQLADATYRLLSDLKKLADQRSVEAEGKQVGASANMRQNNKAVFLADTPDSLQEVRERLYADLERSGRPVYTPGIPPPWPSEEHAAAVGRVLQDASLSVHLLDVFPGRRIEDEQETTYPNKQVELALVSNVPQLIWVPASLNIASVASSSHREFLEQLEKGKRSTKEKEYDFVRESNERIAQLVIEKLAFLEEQATPGPQESSILLDTHLKDQRYAFKLGEVLLDQGLQPFIVQETDDPESGTKEFERRLADVRKLVILFGSVSQRWVERRIECVLQFVAKQPFGSKRQGIESCYVYLLPPQKTGRPMFSPAILRINVLDNSMSDLVRPDIAAPLFQPTAAGAI